jgi:hypothetical protein
MASMMFMDWPGVTREQYEAVRGIAKWDQETPDGAKLHLVGFDDDGMHVTDIWESPEHFDRWMNGDLGAAIQEVGVPGQPNVRWVPVAGVFAPAFGQEGQTDTI